MTIPDKVRIVEVGPRDGLQNEAQHVPAGRDTAEVRRQHGVVVDDGAGPVLLRRGVGRRGRGDEIHRQRLRRVIADGDGDADAVFEGAAR